MVPNLRLSQDVTFDTFNNNGRYVNKNIHGWNRNKLTIGHSSYFFSFYAATAACHITMLPLLADNQEHKYPRVRYLSARTVKLW
jgi:hypothetical protein